MSKGKEVIEISSDSDDAESSPTSLVSNEDQQGQSCNVFVWRL